MKLWAAGVGSALAFASGLGCGNEPCGVTGSAKQCDFSGPCAINIDAGLEKDTKLTERTPCFFRVEFNVFNHANFVSSGLVGNANAGSAFGQATTVAPGLIGQISAKLIF